MDNSNEKTLEKMKKKLYYFLCTLSLIGTLQSQLKPIMFQLKPDTIIRWNYFFGDEFSNSDIIDEKWHRGYPWGGLSIAEDEYADPNNLKLKNGILELYANRSNELKKFPDWMIDSNAMKKYGKKLIDGKYPLKFTGSAIWSKNPIRYGYFECRCKMPAGKGLWPAFWLYGGNPNDEIDFMELKGERPNEIHVDVHCPERCDGGYPGILGLPKNWGEWVKVSSNINQEWNIVSGIWMPGYVMFYLNGDPLAYFKGSFKNSMNVIANLAVAVDGRAFKPGPDANTPFPAKMEVDYIRVWKVPEDSAFMQRNILSFDFDENTKNLNLSKSELPKFKKVKPYMRKKKKMKKELGFISFYPMSNSLYKITNNSGINFSFRVIVKNQKNEIIKEQNFSEVYSTLDLKDVHGKTMIILQYGDKQNQFHLELN